MDTCTVVNMLLSVGKQYSTSTHDMKSLVSKVIVASLKYVDAAQVWVELFGEEDFVDWKLVNSSTTNILGDARVWLSLLSYVSWDSLFKKEAEIRGSYQPLRQLKENIKAVSLDVGGEQTWTLVCKCYILGLIKGMHWLHAFEMLTCDIFKKNTRMACMELIAKQADVNYTPEEQSKNIRFVLKNMEVDVRTLEQHRIIVMAQREEKSLCMKLKSTVAVQGRVRLRDKVKTIYKTDEAKTQEDIMLRTWDSYQGWLYHHSFPPTLSDGIKKKLYFLSCQCRWKWEPHLPRILSSASVITEKVAQFPVSRPDQDVIMSVVGNLSMDGKAPFPELLEFRSVCFQSLPVSHSSKIPLSSVLQAYVSVYQAKEIWAECFRHFIGIISSQIVRECEKFVAEKPFAVEAFMRLLEQS